MNAERFMLLRALERFSELHPDWRLGQTIANLSYWAKGFEQGVIWDVEDGELLNEVLRQLEKSDDPGEAPDPESSS